jgi:hypothetical protein
MKKILLIMAVMSLIASGKCSNGDRNDGGEADQVDTLAPTPSAVDQIVMVYSNAYDGFLNVREQPDTKAPIIGKILNGPMGAVKMGEIGGWTIVKIGDTIGYAGSRYLQTEPTPEFTDKDMEKCIRGIWTNDTPQDQRQVMLFKDGVFIEGYTNEGIVYCGEWSVTGSALLLHIKKFLEPEKGWVDDVQEDAWTVVNGDMLRDNYDEPMRKLKLMTVKQYNDKESIGYGMDWFEVDEYHFNCLYETALEEVKGIAPSGK